MTHSYSSLSSSMEQYYTVRPVPEDLKGLEVAYIKSKSDKCPGLSPLSGLNTNKRTLKSIVKLAELLDSTSDLAQYTCSDILNDM